MSHVDSVSSWTISHAYRFPPARLLCVWERVVSECGDDGDRV